MHANSYCDTSYRDTQLSVAVFIHSFIHPFIHSGHVYSTSSSPLLLISAPDTARILCRSFTPKRHRQLRVKDLPKVQRDSNPRPSGRKISTLPMRHHVPHVFIVSWNRVKAVSPFILRSARLLFWSIDNQYNGDDRRHYCLYCNVSLCMTALKHTALLTRTEMCRLYAQIGG